MSVMWSRRRRRQEQATAQFRPVRTVAGGRGPQTALSPIGGRYAFISRHFLIFGHEVEDGVYLQFDNSYTGQSGLRLEPPGPITFTGIKVKGATWSGAVPLLGSQTIAKGAKGNSERFRPRDVGLDRFVPGQLVCLDLMGTIDVGGLFPVGPFYTWNGGVGSTGFFAIYDIVNHIDQLGTSGDMVAPSGALLGNTFAAAGFEPDGVPPAVPANNMCVGATAVLGTPRRPRSFLLVKGPSTESCRQDVGDPLPVPNGTGYIDRAAYALSIAVQSVTRSGAPFANISTNADGIFLQKFAAGGTAMLGVGANGISAGRTPEQEIAALEASMDSLIADGVTRFIVRLQMPRTTCPGADDFATSTGQALVNGFDFMNEPAELSRLIAELAVARPNITVLAFNDVRALDNIFKWRGATPRMCDDIGTHPEAPANILMAADLVVAMKPDAEGGVADWPDLHRNMYLSCPA